MSAHPPYEPLRRSSEHVPHSLCKSTRLVNASKGQGSHFLDQDLKKDVLTSSTPRHSISTPSMLYNLQRLNQQRSGSISEAIPSLNSLVSPTATPPPMLPSYIKPLPDRFGNDDITYLQNKGALTIPNLELRNELIRCYAEVIHPFMPLLDLHDFVATIDCKDGSKQVGLLLFQSVMFAGIASVPIRYLENAGYTSRRDARRDFFNKTRLLYDFDLEADRIPLIQSLLIMTYWYETPDDQKDSHHWMGIAVSLAQTIGLHRNPANSATIEPARQRLWKRIWWSTYMRDRLIALGMRRPTRIKAGDFDVPMLTVEDFDIQALPDPESSCVPIECSLLRDMEKQRVLAVMCIERQSCALSLAMFFLCNIPSSTTTRVHLVLRAARGRQCLFNQRGTKARPKCKNATKLCSNGRTNFLKKLTTLYRCGMTSSLEMATWPSTVLFST